MAKLQNLRDGKVVAVVESLRTIDSAYGITPEERTVLDILHGVGDFAEENEE
jgi:hypothetical protein